MSVRYRTLSLDSSYCKRHRFCASVMTLPTTDDLPMSLVSELITAISDQIVSIGLLLNNIANVVEISAERDEAIAALQQINTTLSIMLSGTNSPPPPVQ